MEERGLTKISYIFGAKSIAIGVGRALRKLYPENQIMGYMVSDAKGNPKSIDGIPVRIVEEVAGILTDSEKKAICVYVSTPANLHSSIAGMLSEYGFSNYRLVDSRFECELMEKYYAALGLFPSIHTLPYENAEGRLSIYAAKFWKDVKLMHPPIFPCYVHSLLLGCEGNRDRVIGLQTDFRDNEGENISADNSNYCEMTGYYWIWKNALNRADEYVGLYHYRRALDISDADVKRLKANDIDAVLPYPMVHLPDIREHHGRYIKETDWEAMLIALGELYPDYAEAYQDIFSGVYFYNYNLIIAKKKVFADYCAWLFPLLKRTGELSTPKAEDRADRYLAYMSESLFTFYFLYHKELKIYHAGRIMYI